MQIELLETFLDLMETKSFNRTADRLNLTQSTVSARIHTLETMLGKKLFTRSRAGTQPTLPDTACSTMPELCVTSGTKPADRCKAPAISTSRCASAFSMIWPPTTSPIGSRGFAPSCPKPPSTSISTFSNQMSIDLLAGELDLSILFTPKALAGSAPRTHWRGRLPADQLQCRRIADIEPQSYIFTRFSPAFEKVHNPMMADLAEAPLSSGQNITVCGLLSSLGGSAYVLEESAPRWWQRRLRLCRGRAANSPGRLLRHASAQPPFPCPPAPA
jgi:DNA-binding transcriptional LysR family regulator